MSKSEAVKKINSKVSDKVDFLNSFLKREGFKDMMRQSSFFSPDQNTFYIKLDENLYLFISYLHYKKSYFHALSSDLFLFNGSLENLLHTQSYHESFKTIILGFELDKHLKLYEYVVKNKIVPSRDFIDNI